jgi:uncharacterized damage-inducible protein DinB
MNATDPRYPIGRFKYDDDASRDAIDRAVADITSLPKQLRAAAEGLSEDQLNTPYREGGWSSREVVHHVADSHMNAYVRCKLALTEEGPTVKAYNEAEWAKLADVKIVPIGVSLSLIDTLHERWVALLQSMRDEEFERYYIHPEQKRPVPLREVVALYAWHGRHHTGHILSLRERNEWT